MPNIIEITDLSLPELEAYTKLTEAEMLSRREPEKGIFIAEGTTVIAGALDAGCRPISLLMERRHIAGKAAGLVESCGDIPVYTADSGLLSRLTGFPLTRGVLCEMGRPRPLDAASVCETAKRLAVVENLVDAANLGAIFRSAAALGVDGVLLTPSCRDVLSRRTIRVSMGTVFQVPWAKMEGESWAWPENGLKTLSSMGFKTAAMALDDRAVPIDDRRLMSEKKLAIILGSEGDGLMADTIAACDYTVMIPMSKGVDSLNVAAAAAVAFWQLRAR